MGGLYSVDIYSNAVYRIAWAGTGNQPPTAVATVNPNFGSTPLGVTFTGDGSTDPEGQPLAYSWNFGDGSAAGTIANPIHFFFGPVGVPTIYTTTLTVRDAANQTSVAQTLVAVNDTPPQVAITSPPSQGLYSMASGATLPLTANISDAEQGAGQLTCQWQVTLHHNGQLEPGSIATQCATSATILPLGCNGNAYFYSFALTVNDGLGLSTTREVSLYPDCAAQLPVICGNIDANFTRNMFDVVRLRKAFADPIGAPLSPGELARCSVTGDAACDVADLTVLRRYLAGKAPGIAAVCSAAAQ